MSKNRCRQCCFHVRTGPVHMVIPDGHCVEECCQCGALRAMHRDHVFAARGTPMARFPRWVISNEQGLYWSA